MGDIYDKLGEAKTFERGIELEAGDYPSLTLVKFWIHTGYEDALTGLVEVVVNESVKTDDKNPAPAGSRRVRKFWLMDKHGYGRGRMKTFILTMFGKAEGDIPDDKLKKTMRDLLGPDIIDPNTGNVLAVGGEPRQPMRGKTLACTVRNAIDRKTGTVKAQKSGDLATDVYWRHVPQTSEEMKEARAKLDAAEAKK